jgi:NAD(P)H-hydrate epimerase
LKILSAEQVRAADAYTIQNEPIASIDLMERASTAFVKCLLKDFPNADSFTIFCGPGNNGGDGLAIARLLFYRNISVKVFVIKREGSEDFNINFKRLEKLVDIKILTTDNIRSTVNDSSLIIDALFGSGLTRPIEGIAAILIREINLQRKECIAVDIPSGLYMDTVNGESDIVLKCMKTYSFQFPKLNFLFAEYEDICGDWETINIGLHQEFIRSIETSNIFLNAEDLAHYWKRPSRFAHKGDFGRALLMAGSKGKMGAAVLATHSCLRSGVGLMHAYIPGCGYDIMQASVPEAMVELSSHHEELSSDVLPWDLFDAIGIGPGIGTDDGAKNCLKGLFEAYQKPMVLDADALNLLASDQELLGRCPQNSILTPHPGEFNRLFGVTKNSHEQIALLKEKSKSLGLIIVLKGAHTVVAVPNGKLYFNSTGNPGMATGGSGDVLTGIITGFLSQGYLPEYAACLGVFVHGRAGDLAAEFESPRALIASDIIQNLGLAFQSIESS